MPFRVSRFRFQGCCQLTVSPDPEHNFRAQIPDRQEARRENPFQFESGHSPQYDGGLSFNELEMSAEEMRAALRTQGDDVPIAERSEPDVAFKMVRFLHWRRGRRDRLHECSGSRKGQKPVPLNLYALSTDRQRTMRLFVGCFVRYIYRESVIGAVFLSFLMTVTFPSAGTIILNCQENDHG